MGRIVIFGAGGRAAVAEACHRVTAVVRGPQRHGDLAGGGVDVVAGNVTSEDSVARVAAGHDAAISAVHDAAARPEALYPGAARALLAGLARAEVSRLLVVGLAPVLTTDTGVALIGKAGSPAHHRMHLGVEAF